MAHRHWPENECAPGDEAGAKRNREPRPETSLARRADVQPKTGRRQYARLLKAAEDGDAMAAEICAEVQAGLSVPAAMEQWQAAKEGRAVAVFGEGGEA